jgi:hypothetical protein
MQLLELHRNARLIKALYGHLTLGSRRGGGGAVNDLVC